MVYESKTRAAVRAKLPGQKANSELTSLKSAGRGFESEVRYS